ncbi:capsular polysaccharide synthesis protein [Agromyces sp. G08B096]|uniref:Capsular polysaccharide synthesis protein n=1 Tax=Agromyces sp. G08B096 TaxID=3156399 RepID=A0AAU7W5R4_9MICO
MTADDLVSRLVAQVRRAKRYYAPTIDPIASARARLDAQQFVASSIEELRADASATMLDPATPGLDAEPLPVWSYWDGPRDEAPPLVRACLDQLERVHPDACILDATTVDEVAPIAPEAAAALADHPAQRSDLIRVTLLERYGGIWVDATAFAPEPLADRVAPLLDAGALYLRWPGNEVSNWFIAARRGNPLIALQRAALERWWRERGDLPDYFLYHRIFEALRTLDPDARRIARRMPKVSTIPSHLLQLAMLRPYDADEVRLILETALVQKLSYKYDPEAVPAGSVLDRLVTRGL